MSLNSAAVRGEAADNRQAMMDNPGLAGLMTFAPGIGKKLSKNPAAAMLLSQLMSKFAPIGGGAPSNNGINHSGGEFNKI